MKWVFFPPPSLCIISTRLPLCLLVCQSVSPSLQTCVSLIRPVYGKSLLEFDWVWLFVPILMASCQSYVLSVTITVASFLFCLFRWSFPNLAGLLAQTCSFRFRSCLMTFVWRVWSEFELFRLHNLLTKWTRTDNECVNPAGVGGSWRTLQG